MASVYDQLIEIIEEERDKASPSDDPKKILDDILSKAKRLYNTDDFTIFPP